MPFEMAHPTSLTTSSGVLPASSIPTSVGTMPESITACAVLNVPQPCAVLDYYVTVFQVSWREAGHTYRYIIGSECSRGNLAAWSVLRATERGE